MDEEQHDEHVLDYQCYHWNKEVADYNNRHYPCYDNEDAHLYS